MRKKWISKHNTRYTWIILLIGLIILCRPENSRAQGTQGVDMTSKVIDTLNDIISLASWIRIIPAKLAWLFMTNYFVYGTSFFLVNYLFKFRQIIRTFALYALWLYFVGYLLYSWFNTKEAKSKIADLIKNTIIAWILISMSWRLMAAVVDLSVVFTSVVASIPSQIYEEEWQRKWWCFSAPIIVNIDPDRKVDTNTLSNPQNYTQLLERKKIQPEWDDVSWPLMFFGVSVLRFFHMSFQPTDHKTEWSWSIDANEQRQLSKTIIISFVKALLALWLVVPMVILMVVNLIRIVFLWLWIVFAPGIILINVFGLKLSDGLDKYFSRQNILGLVMQPVAVIGALSIWFIFIIELASIFNLCTETPPENNDKTLQATTLSEWIKAPIGELASPIGTDTTLWASLSALGDVVGGVTWELLMAIFVIVLMWSLIKIGFSTSELTKGVAKKITDGVESMMAAIPIVPLPGVWSIGLWAAKKFAEWGFWTKNWLNAKENEQTNLLRERLGMKIGEVNVPALKTYASKPTTTLQELWKEISAKTEKRVISAENAKAVVESRLQSANQQVRRKALSELRLPNLINDRTADTLKTLWTDTKTKDEAYKLLNRLFSWWEQPLWTAVDQKNNIDQYGNRNK